MNRAALNEGLRRMRFEIILDRQKSGGITQLEAAEMLGINERTFRRWRDRFDEEGAPGLADWTVHQRIDAAPTRHPALDKALQVVNRLVGAGDAKAAKFGG